MSGITPGVSIGGGYGETGERAVGGWKGVGVGDIKAFLDVTSDVSWVIAGDGWFGGFCHVLGVG